MSDTASGNQQENAPGGPKGGFNTLLNGLKNTDIAFALGMVVILLMLIMPMPGWLLDVMLAASITFSVMVLMTVLFVEKPLHFNSFPTILLVATMLRLALNLASTRLILSKGHEGTDAAGQVIEAFGQFPHGRGSRNWRHCILNSRHRELCRNYQRFRSDRRSSSAL